MEEIWKVIEEFPKYSVSDLGRVKRSIGGQGCIAGKILSLYLNDGYSFVALWWERRIRNRAVARLVAIAFLPNPDNLPEVNHKDRNRTNNCKSNLEWVTRQGNMDHWVASRNNDALRSVRECHPQG